MMTMFGCPACSSSHCLLQESFHQQLSSYCGTMLGSRLPVTTRVPTHLKAPQPSFRSSIIACNSRQEPHATSSAPQMAAAAVASILLGFNTAPVHAVGLESVDLLPSLEAISTPDDFKAGAENQAAKLKAADDAFESSDTLKRLLEKSEANRDKNKKAIANKYCMRQAEIGVGDCGGLRYIPGMTNSGKQRTPDWLSDLLGVERAPAESEDTLTLEKLFAGQPVAE